MLGPRAISWLELGRRTVFPGPRLAKLASFQANHSLRVRLPLLPVSSTTTWSVDSVSRKAQHWHLMFQGEVVGFSYAFRRCLR